MTGELFAFMVFISLMLLWIAWMMRRGKAAVDKLNKDIEDIEKRRKQPP